MGKKHMIEIISNEFGFDIDISRPCISNGKKLIIEILQLQVDARAMRLLLTLHVDSLDFLRLLSRNQKALKL